MDCFERLVIHNQVDQPKLTNSHAFEYTSDLELVDVRQRDIYVYSFYPLEVKAWKLNGKAIVEKSTSITSGSAMS